MEVAYGGHELHARADTSTMHAKGSVNAMKAARDTFATVPLPPLRQAELDILRVAHGKHLIHGLLEVDVTEARRRIREMKDRTGEAVSFTAFIIACVARAVDEHKAMHAYRKRQRLVLFDQVDVTTQVERGLAGHKVVIPYIIRAANEKTLSEIHHEIRAAQTEPVERADVFGKIQWYLLLPRPLRGLFWRILGSNPTRIKRFGGTVAVTSVGMFGKGIGWAIPMATSTLTVAIGGIAQRPSLADGRIAIGEHLCLTVSMDHDVIDGAPAARFAARLVELIEGGVGLSGAVGAGM